MHSFPLRRSLVIVSLAAGLIAGCSKDDGADLKLVTVKGKATARGGKTVSDGMLEFRPAGDVLVGAAVADIGSDGSFTARTLLRQKSREGMAPGKYVVSYLPKQGGDQMVEPITLEGELTVPDTGFTDASPLKIELPIVSKSPK